MPDEGVLENKKVEKPVNECFVVMGLGSISAMACELIITIKTLAIIILICLIFFCVIRWTHILVHFKSNSCLFKLIFYPANKNAQTVSIQILIAFYFLQFFNALWQIFYCKTFFVVLRNKRDCKLAFVLSIILRVT